jgi:two-component system cell cycle response regulator
VSAPRILVADDSPLVLRMMEKLFQGEGFEVETARDGLEAMEKAIAGDFNLFILDVMMPRMNGYQACRILKTEPTTQPIPVVILTSKDQAGDKFWGLEIGADHYVTKDSDPQRILELVKGVVAAQASAPRAARPEAQRTSVDILSRVNDLLDRKLFEATILQEIGRVARSLVHFDETFTSIMAVVARVVDYSVGAMAFVEDEDLEVVLVLRRPAAPAAVEEAKARLLEAVARYRKPGESFAKVQARLFAPGGDAAQDPPEAALGGFASFPIVTNGRLTGLLALGGKAAARIGADTGKFLADAANLAHIVAVNSRLVDRLRNLSIRDGLTDLYNHRHSVELLGHEFERVGRYEGGVTVLMIDIDHFKRVNDELGHPAGDIVLREVARLIKDTLRSVDALGRYGGEEFLAILPHTGPEEGRMTAERVRRAVEEHVFRAAGRELRLSVSVGTASYPQAVVDSPAALIRLADAALYQAKNAGRNRVA